MKISGRRFVVEISSTTILIVLVVIYIAINS